MLMTKTERTSILEMNEYSVVGMMVRKKTLHAVMYEFNGWDGIGRTSLG